MGLAENIDGNGQAISFGKLMQLDKLSEFDFKSTVKAHRPGAPNEEHKGAYGGHVYSQAVFAASHTVGQGYISVTGFWIVGGNADIPFDYHVRIIRDGRNYCVRAADVTQEGTKGVCFSCICSFKKEDVITVEFQEKTNMNEKFASVLEGKRPEDHPDAPSIDVPWFKNSPEKMRIATPFPGIRSKKVKMEKYNSNRPPIDRRQLNFYSTIGPIPSISTSPNLHACAHLYASDRNSLSAVADHLNIEDVTPFKASLNHTVIFHNISEAMSTTTEESETGSPKWFLQEAWTDRIADGRGVHHSRLWDLKTGIHIGTSVQDGMMRLVFHDEDEMMGTKRDLDNGRPKI